MNILFTDKTGTLTEGRLSVGEIFLGAGREFSSLRGLKKCERVYKSFILCAYANSSRIRGRNAEGKSDALGGNSTDRAIMLSSMRAEGQKPSFTLIDRLPFDCFRQY